MKNLILVDDEILVRVGLKSLLNWEEMGYQIVGEFGDANEAIEFLKKTPVQFILTDLYMKPGDGFELIEWVRKEYQDSGIIVLSCHNEFGDVQKAIRLGADDYIFKLSLNQDEILNALNRVSQRRGNSVISNSKQQNKILNIKKDELLSFLENNLENGVGNRMSFYHILTITYNNEGRIEPLKDILSQNGFVEFNFIYEKSSLIYCISKDLSNSEIKDKVEEIINLSEKYISIPIQCGISSGIFDSLDIILSGIKESLTASTMKFYNTDKHYSFYSDFKIKRETFYGELIKVDFFTNIEILKESIFTNNFLDIEHLITLLFDSLKKVSPPIINTTRHYIVDILTAFRTKLYTHDILLSEIEEDNENSLITVILNGQTLNQIRNKFIMFLKVYETKITSSQTKIRPDIGNAMKFIYENCTKGITLTDIADNSNLNPSYFSHIFKKETGHSVIDYLHIMQIEKAKELLLTHSYMVYEVAELIGMQNANYFSTLFKKVTGKNPQDYLTKY